MALQESEVTPSRHFPINTFFDVVGYRDATSALTDNQIRTIDAVQATFKEAIIPTQIIETDDRAKVAIVFERVNRLGVELDTLQLLSAWTWSEDLTSRRDFKSCLTSSNHSDLPVLAKTQTFCSVPAAQ